MTYDIEVSLVSDTTAPWSVAINGTPATVTAVAQAAANTLQLTVSPLPSDNDAVQVGYAPAPHTVFSPATGAAAIAQTGDFVA